MTKGYQNVPLIQMYFSSHSVGATFIEKSSFHFSSPCPFGKLRKASLCFSPSLQIASLHHLVSPEESGSLDNFTASFLLQLQARPPVTVPVPNSRWAAQGRAMWELGTFLPVSPVSFWQPQSLARSEIIASTGKTYKSQHLAENSLS